MEARFPIKHFMPECWIAMNLLILGRVLSPLAYQLLGLLTQEQPRQRSLEWLGTRLGLSAWTVRTLKRELQTTVPLALACD